jgi:hypothetical protein
MINARKPEKRREDKRKEKREEEKCDSECFSFLFYSQARVTKETPRPYVWSMIPMALATANAIHL